MVKFSDASHRILSEYFDILATPKTGTHNSFIQGQRHTISAKGGLDTTLYQKNDNGDFIAHRFLIQQLSGDNFTFQYISQTATHSEATSLEVGKEMYFRKDSLFHDWLKTHATEYEQSLNTNKTFIYFGTLYSISGETNNYNIIFEGMKNWAEYALPEHNRTDKIVELLKIFFDDVYQDIYNMTKTLWSFFDAREVDIDHINYLASRANITTDKDKISTELLLREFVDELPWWLKRKGTYSSYLSLFKILLGNTKNKLNFYERWAEWCLKYLRENEGLIYNTDFQDHHYLEFYGRTPTGGAGPFYYNNFDHNNYPTYTDTAPNEAGCLENKVVCNRQIELDTFNGTDTGSNLTAVGYHIQIDGYNPGVDDLYTYITQPVSGVDMNHCLTVSMASNSQPSGALFVWACSDHQDKTLTEHYDDNENWIGISFELLGDAPSGTVTGRRFRLWDAIPSASTSTVESSGTYNSDTEYYLSIEKYQDELVVKTYNDPAKRDQFLIDRMRLPLTQNKAYNTLYIPTYLEPDNLGGVQIGMDFTGDIQNFYAEHGTTSTIALSGNMILSPHYRIEIDLSSEPMGDDFIISENQATELLRYWTYLKPVSKFVHYNWLLSPVGQIDEYAKSIPLYDNTYTAFCNTQFLAQSLVSAGVAVDLGPGGDYYENLYTETFLISQDPWNIYHNLDTSDLIIQTYDQNDYQMWPISHLFQTNNKVQLDWATSVRGKVYIAELKSWNYSHFQSTPSTAWSIDHNLGTSGASGIVFEIVSVSGASSVTTYDSFIDTHFNMAGVWGNYFGPSAWSVSGGFTYDSGRNVYEITGPTEGVTFAVLEPVSDDWANSGWDPYTGGLRTSKIRVTYTTSGSGINPSASYVLNGQWLRRNIDETYVLDYTDGTWTVGGAESSKITMPADSESPNKIVFYHKGGDEMYVYKDFGAGYWKDFEMRWVYHRNSQAGLYPEMVTAVFRNVANEWGDAITQSPYEDAIAVEIGEQTSTFTAKLWNNGTQDSMTLQSGSPYEPNDGPVYFRMKRIGPDLRLWAYSDPRDGRDPYVAKEWYGNLPPTSAGHIGTATETPFRYFQPVGADTGSGVNTGSDTVSAAQFTYIEDVWSPSGVWRELEWTPIAESSVPENSGTIVLTADTTDWWYDRPGDIYNLRFKFRPTTLATSGASGADYYFSQYGDSVGFGVISTSAGSFFNYVPDYNYFTNLDNAVDGNRTTYAETNAPAESGILEHTVTIAAADLLYQDRSDDLTSFPIKIHLSDYCGKNKVNMGQVFTKIGSNYSKFRVIDEDNTNLWCEVEHWDATTSGATVWCRVPQITAGVDKVLTLQFDPTKDDNPRIGITGTQAAANVWDRYYTYVYHMNQVPVSGTASILNSIISSGGDLTPYTYRATQEDQRNFATYNLREGLADYPSGGYALKFHGDRPYDAIGQLETNSAFSPLNENQINIEAFFRIDEVPAGTEDDWIMTGVHTDGLNVVYGMYIDDVNESVTGQVWVNGAAEAVGSPGVTTKGPGNWIYTNFKWADDGIGQGAGILLNTNNGDKGYQITSGGTPRNGIIDRGSTDLIIGGMNQGTAYPQRRINGLIGETRYSRIARNNTYGIATAKTLEDNLLTFETIPDSDITLSFYTSANAFTGGSITSGASDYLDLTSGLVIDNEANFSQPTSWLRSNSVSGHFMEQDDDSRLVWDFGEKGIGDFEIWIDIFFATDNWQSSFPTNGGLGAPPYTGSEITLAMVSNRLNTPYVNAAIYNEGLKWGIHRTAFNDSATHVHDFDQWTVGSDNRVFSPATHPYLKLVRSGSTISLTPYSSPDRTGGAAGSSVISNQPDKKRYLTLFSTFGYPPDDFDYARVGIKNVRLISGEFSPSASPSVTWFPGGGIDADFPISTVQVKLDAGGSSDAEWTPWFSTAASGDTRTYPSGGTPQLYDITTDTNAPAPWTWADVESLRAKFNFTPGASADYFNVAKGDVIVSYTGNIDSLKIVDGDNTTWASAGPSANAHIFVSGATVSAGDWPDNIDRVRIRTYSKITSAAGDTLVKLIPYFGETSGSAIDITDTITSTGDYTPWIRIDNDPNAPAEWTESDVDDFKIYISFQPGSILSTLALSEVDLRLTNNFVDRTPTSIDYQIRNIELWESAPSANASYTVDLLPKKAESYIRLPDRTLPKDFEFWFDFEVTSAGYGNYLRGGEMSIFTVSDQPVRDIRDFDRLPSGANAITLRAASTSGSTYMMLSEFGPSAGENVNKWNVGGTDYGTDTSIQHLYLKLARHQLWGESNLPAVVVEYYPNSSRTSSSMIKRQTIYLQNSTSIYTTNYLYILNALGNPSGGLGGFGEDLTGGLTYAPDASATFYFNSYDSNEDWTTSPANMADGDADTYAQSTTTEAQVLDGNNATSNGSDIFNVRLRAKGLAGHPPANWYLEPYFNNVSGGQYDLKSRLPLSDQSIYASGGEQRWYVYGLKPGKPMPKLADGVTNRYRPGIKNGYYSGFDNNGNFIVGSLDDYKGHPGVTKSAADNPGCIHLCKGASTLVDMRFEPSAAKYTDLTPIVDTYAFNEYGGSWYQGATFYNSTTERFGMSIQNSGPSQVRILEFTYGVENGGDYNNQLVCEKDLLLTGHSWDTGESIISIAYEPTTDSYIMGTFQSAGNPWYSFNATTGALQNKKTAKYQGGCYGVATSGGLAFLYESAAAATRWIIAVDPVSLGAPDTDQWNYTAPSAINLSFLGTGFGYGGLSINPVTGIIYMGSSTGSQWHGVQKWTRNQLIADTLSDYSEWIDITNDVNAPETWTWSDVMALECRNVYEESTDSSSDKGRTSIVEIAVDYNSQTADIEIPAVPGDIMFFTTVNVPEDQAQSFVVSGAPTTPNINGANDIVLDSEAGTAGFTGVFADENFVYFGHDSSPGGELSTYTYGADGELTFVDADASVGSDCNSVHGDGTYIYTANGTAGVNAYSVDGSGNITHLDTYDPGTQNFLDVYADGTYIYAAAAGDGLYVLSFNGSSFSFVDSDDQGGYYNTVHSDGTYIYVGEDAGVMAYSQSSGILSYITKQQDDGGAYNGGIHSDDDYIYCCTSNGLYNYTFNGSSFTKVSSAPVLDSWNPVAVWSDNAGLIYTTEYYDGVSIYNLGPLGQLSRYDYYDPGGLYYRDIWGVNTGTASYTIPATAGGYVYNNPSWDGKGIPYDYTDNNYWTGENSTIVGPSGTKTWSWATTGWAFTGSNATSATFQPGQSSDDGYVTEGSSSFNNVGNALYSDVAREAFVRFPNVNIPPGARIKAATLTVHANNTNSGDVYSRLYFNKETDAVAPTSFAEWQALSFSTNYIEYFSDAFVDNYDYTFFDKDTGADLSVALQEIIDQPGWSSGNAIMILSDESPTETSTGTRLWDSWDQNSGVGSPMLRVTWDDNGATQSTFSTSGWQPLTTVGTWAQDFRPVRARINWIGPGTAFDKLRIVDTLGNTLASASTYQPNENLVFNDWSNNADINLIQVSGSSGPWAITNIEFLVSGSYGDTITGYSQSYEQIYDDSPDMIFPKSAHIESPNRLVLTFAEPVDGKCFIRDHDYYHQQTVADTIWTVNHNLNIDGALVQCYDSNGYYVMPLSIELVNENTTQIIFNQAIAGTAVFVIFQGTFIPGDFLGLFTGRPPGYWKAGNGGDEVGFDPLNVNDINNTLVSGGIDEFSVTTSAASGYVLINFEVPAASAYNFNEFGIFDSNKDLHYYTQCSDIYKPDGVSLNMRYRIAKQGV